MTLIIKEKAVTCLLCKVPLIAIAKVDTITGKTMKYYEIRGGQRKQSPLGHDATYCDACIQKMDPAVIANYLNKYDILHLHYLTHIDNVPSMLANGIMSFKKVKSLGLLHYDISDNYVQARREHRSIPNINRSIHSYVPLYFATQTPMHYVITHSDKTKKHHSIISQDNIVFLDINAQSIFQTPGVFFTDGNAASHDTAFYTNLADLDKLNWQNINHPCSYPQGYDPEWRRTKASEVLVPDNIPPKYISRIVVFSQETATKLCIIVKRLYPKIYSTQFQYSDDIVRSYYFVS